MPSLSFRVEGAADASGKITKFNQAALKLIQQKAAERADKTVLRFKEEMAREYTSAWATGMLARGITHKTFVKGNGVEVKFYIEGRKELRYVTAALGGQWQQFPVGPFVIRPVKAKSLLVPFPNSSARQFLRGAGGRFRGSASTAEAEGGPGIRVKQVLWGSRTGGFSRDVISEVAASESVLFVEDLTSAVQGIAVTLT